MSRVAVTGSSGRLGRSVVSVLNSLGNEVFCLDRLFPSGSEEATLTSSDSSHVSTIDLTNFDDTVALFADLKPDAVVHLAAIAVPFSAPEHVILRTNATLAFNVIQGAVSAGVRKIITASSPTVQGYGAPIGWIPERLPLDESMEPNPWNAYALSKLIAERTMRMFAAQCGDSVRLAAFRPCYVIAPEEWLGALTQQGHTVRQRLDDPSLGAPALFNYVDARDVGRFIHILIEALTEIPNAQVFYVGARDALARKSLAELIPEYFPEAAQAASELTGSQPAFSIEKAHRLLGWQPERTWRSELSHEPRSALDCSSAVPVSSLETRK